MTLYKDSCVKNSLGGIYIHIPYCLSKCNYCDFVSVPIDNHLPQYLDELGQEIQLRSKDFSFMSVDSIFFGGGTPSLLSIEQIERILTQLHENYSIQNDCEITIEANPDTITKELISGYRSLGMNRISIGVQSLHDDVLAMIRRRHTAQQAINAILWAHEAGFTSINCDFIIGLPNETDRGIEEQTQQIGTLPITHISTYFLTLSRKTPNVKQIRLKQISIPSEKQTLHHWNTMVKEICAHGFRHYEISNFAKPSHECRHNLHYWNLDSWAAFGLSATGHCNPDPMKRSHRYTNFSSFFQYSAALALHKTPTGKMEKLTEKQTHFEKNMLHFRLLNKGILLSDIPLQNRKILHDFYCRGWVRFQYEHPLREATEGIVHHCPRIVLTEKGVVVSNEIIVRLLQD
ncbi:MAG: radical SAM family heme chaperone HemW [Caldisericia bacterium]|nr:radical SAM family heme chaperone HemW [Caldisericia bacterium]